MGVVFRWEELGCGSGGDRWVAAADEQPGRPHLMVCAVRGTYWVVHADGERGATSWFVAMTGRGLADDARGACELGEPSRS